MNKRVQIPAYTVQWMMGDRYGEVVKVRKGRIDSDEFRSSEIAYVKLDKSGKTVRFILDDCTEV